MGNVIKLSGVNFSGNSLGICRNEIAIPTKIYEKTGNGLLNGKVVCQYDGPGMKLLNVYCYKIPNNAKALIGLISVIRYDTYVNPSASNTFHPTSRPIVGDSIIDTIYPANSESLTANINANFVSYEVTKVHTIYPYCFDNFRYPIILVDATFNISNFNNKYIYVACVHINGKFNVSDPICSSLNDTNYQLPKTITKYDNPEETFYCDYYDTTSVALDQPKLYWVYE